MCIRDSLNTLAVVLVVLFPPLRESILAATEWVASAADRSPSWLALYLGMLSVGLPVIVYALPEPAAALLLGALVLVMVIGPRLMGVRSPDDGEPPTDPLALSV